MLNALAAEIARKRRNVLDAAIKVRESQSYELHIQLEYLSELDAAVDQLAEMIILPLNPPVVTRPSGKKRNR